MAPLVPRLLCVALFAAAGNAAGQRSKCKKRDMAGSLKDCRTIFLDFDKLSKPEVDKIVALVGSESNLRFLSLRDNGIDEADALALAEALKHNRNLYSLRYRENPLGAAVVGAIASHPALTDLDVRGTKIGDEGAASLAQLLSSSAVLTGLQLRSASIGESGAVALARSLTHHPALALLDLGNNAVGDAGAVALAEALQTNRVLEKLEIQSPSVTSSGWKALDDAMDINAVVSVIGYRGGGRKLEL